MKLAVLGGSAFSTPRLVRYLAARTDVEPLTVALAGRTKSHVTAVARASCMLAEHSRVTVQACTLEAPAELSKALAGADVVLIQMRIGGYTGRGYDETFPLSFGICGDEGLGPGGLSAAWRGWPAFHEVLTAINAICPRARVLVLSSPLGLLVRLAYMAFPNLDVAGICELPFATLCRAAETAGCAWTQLEWEYIGINHIGWFYNVSTSGSVVPWDAQPIALKYVRLHDDASAVLNEQRSRRVARSDELQELKVRALAVYQHGDLPEIEQALDWRNANWYEQAVGPVIAVLAGGSSEMPFFLTIPQRGIYSGFANDDVMELPHTVIHDRQLTARPCSTRPPAHLSEIVARFVCYERKAARAVLDRDPGLLTQALSLHPWIPDSIALGELSRAVVRGANIAIGVGSA